MAASKPFGPVVARRQIRTLGTRPRRVTITLGTPRLPKGESDWECPFRLSGGGIRVLEYAYGVDSMQALQNALQGVRTSLDKSGKSFEWVGMRMDDGGFQRSIPWYGDSRFTRRVERLVELELRREVGRLRRRHQQRQKRNREGREAQQLARTAAKKRTRKN